VKYQGYNLAIVSVGRLLMGERSWRNDVALVLRALDLGPVGGRQGRTGVASKMEVECGYQVGPEELLGFKVMGRGLIALQE
jgi:hypothetical protein